MRTLQRLVVHHSATARDVTWRAIDRAHRRRGFDRIGYHYVIEEDGSVRVGRKLWDPGAHVLHENEDTIGLCVVGDNTRPDALWNSVQIDALRELVEALTKVLPGLRITGHRDIAHAPTACPGLDIQRLVRDLARL